MARIPRPASGSVWGGKVGNVLNLLHLIRLSGTCVRKPIDSNLPMVGVSPLFPAPSSHPTPTRRPTALGLSLLQARRQGRRRLHLGIVACFRSAGIDCHPKRSGGGTSGRRRTGTARREAPGGCLLVGERHRSAAVVCFDPRAVIVVVEASVRGQRPPNATGGTRTHAVDGGIDSQEQESHCYEKSFWSALDGPRMERERYRDLCSQSTANRYRYRDKGETEPAGLCSQIGQR